MKKDQKNLHDHLAIVERLLLIGFIIMIIPMFFQNALWTGIFLFVGFGIMAAACIYHHKYFKCPHCGGRLNVRGVPKYCPDCGKEIV